MHPIYWYIDISGRPEFLQMTVYTRRLVSLRSGGNYVLFQPRLPETICEGNPLYHFNILLQFMICWGDLVFTMKEKVARYIFAYSLDR